MLEHDYKRDIMTALQYYDIDVQDHEDKHKNFIPDLSFAGHRVDGWIEVKYLDKEPTTLGSIEHWTQGQEEWLVNRARSGAGWCFLWIGTPKMHYLWRPHQAREFRLRPFESASTGAWLKDRTLATTVERFMQYVRMAGVGGSLTTIGGIPVPGGPR